MSSLDKRAEFEQYIKNIVQQGPIRINTNAQVAVFISELFDFQKVDIILTDLNHIGNIYDIPVYVDPQMTWMDCFIIATIKGQDTTYDVKSLIENLF